MDIWKIDYVADDYNTHPLIDFRHLTDAVAVDEDDIYDILHAIEG